MAKSRRLRWLLPGNNNRHRKPADDHLFPPAPEPQISEWLNTADAITLNSLRGRIVLLHAFQMLCPACVSYGIPQAIRVWRTFKQTEVVVIALHTIFENYSAMSPDALRAFVMQHKLPFPIGIDRGGPGESIPATMYALQLQGTPSTVLIDRSGRVRLHHLGAIKDLLLGAMIDRLIAEPYAT